MLAGVDFSGDKSTGNRRYMGIVVGTKEGISAVVTSLESSQIHMRTIRNREKRNAMVSKLRFDGNTAVALCIWLDKDVMIGKIRTRKRGHRYPKKRVLNAYDYILCRYIQKLTTAFCVKHGCVIREATFQCDGDCVDFVRHNGLKRGYPGDAHMLADIVAWSNNRGREPAGVMPIDLRDNLEAEMKKRFK